MLHWVSLLKEIPAHWQISSRLLPMSTRRSWSVNFSTQCRSQPTPWVDLSLVTTTRRRHYSLNSTKPRRTTSRSQSAHDRAAQAPSHRVPSTAVDRRRRKSSKKPHVPPHRTLSALLAAGCLAMTQGRIRRGSVRADLGGPSIRRAKAAADRAHAAVSLLSYRIGRSSTDYCGRAVGRSVWTSSRQRLDGRDSRG